MEKSQILVSSYGKCWYFEVAPFVHKQGSLGGRKAGGVKAVIRGVEPVLGRLLEVRVMSVRLAHLRVVKWVTGQVMEL